MECVAVSVNSPGAHSLTPNSGGVCRKPPVDVQNVAWGALSCSRSASPSPWPARSGSLAASQARFSARLGDGASERPLSEKPPQDKGISARPKSAAPLAVAASQNYLLLIILISDTLGPEDRFLFADAPDGGGRRRLRHHAGLARRPRCRSDRADGADRRVFPARAHMGAHRTQNRFVAPPAI